MPGLEALPMIEPLFQSSKSSWASFQRFIGSRIAWSRNTGYKWSNKPYRANNTLLNTATIRRCTIELMQNAASTASAAEYPSKSIVDIAKLLSLAINSRDQGPGSPFHRSWDGKSVRYRGRGESSFAAALRNIGFSVGCGCDDQNEHQQDCAVDGCKAPFPFFD